MRVKLCLKNSKNKASNLWLFDSWSNSVCSRYFWSFSQLGEKKEHLVPLVSGPDVPRGLISLLLFHSLLSFFFFFHILSSSHKCLLSWHCFVKLETLFIELLQLSQCLICLVKSIILGGKIHSALSPRSSAFGSFIFCYTPPRQPVSPPLRQQHSGPTPNSTLAANTADGHLFRNSRH